jgi:uncharacterized FAD-dependent dehydrogenase
VNFDIVIAGAGPAGISCAQTIKLANPEADVLLLEAGRSYEHRPCPVDKGFQCTGCAGICNVISGFGGCMHYGDGVKLSLLPSGRRLIDLFGETRAHELCDLAFNFLVQDLSSRPVLQGKGLSHEAVDAFSLRGLAIREYPVAVLAESDLSALIRGAHRRTTEHITLWEGAELSGADRTTEGFALQVRREHQITSITTRRLVLATGRRGVTSTKRLLAGLGVETETPDMSLGVRFEARANLLAAIGDEHPDLKISQLDGRKNKTKTFCFCGGPNGGRIKMTNYQDSFGPEIITLDGHETTERVPGGRPLAANFGLLVQLNRGRSGASVQGILDDYRKLSGGRPAVQTLGSFLRRLSDDATWPEICSRLSFEPSVVDLVPARVDLLFREDEHADLIAGFSRVMDAILAHGRFERTHDELENEIVVIGPEIEFLWDRVAVDANCQVSGLPLHVLGDAAGIAQGVVQAAMMGIAAGESIAR